MKEKPFFEHKRKETFNFKQELFRYLKNWKWFLLCIVLFVIAAFYSIRYSPIIYETNARIKIINQKINEIELPGNLNSLFEDSKVNLENEIEILKSYRILEQVSKKLDLNARYYIVNKIKSTEVWGLPITVYATDSLKLLPTSGEYFINVLESGYIIKDAENNEWEIPTHNLNTSFKNLPFLINFDKSKPYKRLIGKQIKVRFFSIKEATLRLLPGIRVEQVGKNSEVLKLSLRSESSKKSEAILNEIITQFNQDGVNDRRLIFQRTIDFVDERFEYLSIELDSIENRKKQFKEVNDLSNIDLDTEFTLSDKSNSNAEKVNLETQLEVAKILRKTLSNQSNSKLLPANIGLGISGINDQINLYNSNVLELKKLKISAGANNPIVINFNRDISNLKNSILSSVVSYQKKCESSLRNIRVVDNKNKGFFHALPSKEKVLREIERDQSIKENLFIFLLQRREEAAINLVITAPTLKVVDYAITNLIPVSESPKLLYLKAIIAGLVFPFIVFYLIFFIDSALYSKEDILKRSRNTQVIGSIPYSFGKKIFNGLNDDSLLSEGFRVLRTNVRFEFKKQNPIDHAKIIMVTSSKSNEGKTFCAINLAISFAALNKKVLLIETNFRNPTIKKQLKTNINLDKGLSNYLKGEEENYSALIKSFNIKETFIDVLSAGTIPNAPAELLSNGKLEVLLELLKKDYDYIITDTPSTSLITDTLLISDIADLTLYITKEGFTEKKLIYYSEELIFNKKLKNVYYVLNHVKAKSFSKIKYAKRKAIS
ncbi:tyrosine-protein kinase domain-containing protein [uncultured Polaribacter sp.]|uniref:GumC family protein n=1 Tax=uncultured Polaribacter sp. TaxID=174711 RepID=UPI00261309ED|nr:tyrosine-protein kinase domain-containing protein [uncultured Polaribacter sp.]